MKKKALIFNSIRTRTFEFVLLFLKILEKRSQRYDEKKEVRRSLFITESILSSFVKSS